MDRLSEIRDRCDAATPGPWWWSLSDLRVVVWGGAQDGNAATGKQIVVDGDEDFDCCPENAEFITNAREDIPYLLERLNIATARAEKAEAENRWIPVSERMPKDPGWYQVFRKGHSHAEDGYFRGKTWSFGKHYGEVTHWRPLPEPPKGV